GARSCWPPPWLLTLNGSWARTTASVPLVVWVNRWSKTLPIVSVNTNVPATKPTPRMIDIEVSSSRNLCASSPLRVTSHMPRSVPEFLHAVEDLVGCGFGHLVDDLAVDEEDHPLGAAGTDGVVGDHDDRLAELVDG